MFATISNMEFHCSEEGVISESFDVYTRSACVAGFILRFIVLRILLIRCARVLLGL